MRGLKAILFIFWSKSSVLVLIINLWVNFCIKSRNCHLSEYLSEFVSLIKTASLATTFVVNVSTITAFKDVRRLNFY